MATEEMRLKYVKLCADDDGETHFKDEEVVMTETGYAPPAPPLWVGPQGKATGITVLGFPPDLIFTVGQYVMVCMALNSLGVQLDPGLEGLPDR